MEKFISELYDNGIIPVVKIDDENKAVDLVKSLKKKGLTIIEITFRTPQAKEAIRKIADFDPEFNVGAGTILTIEQLDQAIKAGAKFIVTPGFNKKIVNEAQKRGIPIIPGVSTASEIEEALEEKISVMKFFPAEAMGGLNTIKALSGPYPNVKFIPTGGISLENMSNYTNDARILAVGSSWMTESKDLNEGNFETIEQKIEQTMIKLLDLSFDHVGVLSKNYEIDVTDLSNLTKHALSKHSKSSFVGQVEVIKEKHPDISDVHLAYKTSNIRRAMHYFDSLGYEFNHDTKVFDNSGNLKAIYFKLKFVDVSIHLIQR